MSDTIERPEAESQFLPDGRQWAWNSSSLGPAKQCPRKYFYQVVEGWHPKSSSDDLIFGWHYAKALEMYHRWRCDGIDYQEALRNTLSATLVNTREWVSAHTAKTRETLIRSIVWYLDTYENDPCQTVRLSSGRPAVELSFRFQLDDDIMLCGHLDRIVAYGNDYYVQDQKTTGATLGGYYFNRFNPDNQMSLYTIAAEVIWKQPVKGVMIDAAQIAVGFTRFERGFTFRTTEQNEQWLKDTRYWVHRTWEAAEAGYPMNDSACMLYGGCPFRSVCAHDPSVRRNYLETLFDRRPDNPLER
jgi:hypothetical protein